MDPGQPTRCVRPYGVFNAEWHPRLTSINTPLTSTRGFESGSLAKTFFRATDLSIRRVSQSMHRLGLIFASLRSDQKSFMIAAVVALILRTIDRNIYQRLARGELSDADVVDGVFNRPSLQDIQHQHEGILFEAVIIVASHEEELYSMTPSELPDSPLLQRHFAIINNSDGEITRKEQERSRDVIARVEELRAKFYLDSGGIGFAHSVRRLELLTHSLFDESSQQDVE